MWIPICYVFHPQGHHQPTAVYSYCVYMNKVIDKILCDINKKNDIKKQFKWVETANIKYYTDNVAYI